MDTALLDEKEIRYRLSTVEDPPTLPLALQRVLELIINEVESPDELETFIRYDQGLTTRIIRIANSAYNDLSGKPLNLSRSIYLIGFEEVKSICVVALVREVFSGLKTIEPPERERLWKHSFATARIAYEIARRMSWIAKEEAYLLGFLHDLGRIIVAAHFGDQYRAMHKLALKRKVPLRYVEPQFNLAHTQIGSWISKRWALPELVRIVMEFHHEPEKSNSFESEVKLVALADILANSREFPEYLDDDFTLMYRKDINISDKEWDEYKDRLEEIWPVVDQFWNLLK